MFTKKGQGEIFGLALVFVILILGIIVYAQFKALNPDLEKNSFKDGQFDVLAKNTLTSIRYMSTGCFVQSKDDSLQALLGYCFDFSNAPDHDPLITCKDDFGSDFEVGSCSYAMELFNSTLQSFFNKNVTEDRTSIAPIPFSLTFTNEHFQLEKVHNVTLTNMYDFGISLNRSSTDYYKKKRYQKANGGFFILPTGKRPVELEFDVYYR